MMDNLRHSAMQVFTILFSFHKFHGLYYETQQFRVKETLTKNYLTKLSSENSKYIKFSFKLNISHG